MAIHYNFVPFASQLNNLKGPELINLKEVSEGWYIDYKAEGLPLKTLAKHLSAFANQYGGWLFFGIAENRDGTRTAKEFCGVSNDNLAELLEKIREAATTHVTPEVFYEEKIISGPIEEIGLASNKSIIIIGIPQGLNPPYVHSSGRIYRRVADKSEPKEETDRHVLDILWERGNETRNKLDKFLSQTIRIPEDQKNNPWLHIYFVNNPLFNNSGQLLTFSDFKEIIAGGNSEKNGCNVPMDNIFSTCNGFFARQTKNTGVPFNIKSINFRWWHDGNARLSIPLNVYNVNDFYIKCSDKQYVSKFIDIIGKDNYDHVRILDCSLIAKAVLALTNQYLCLIDKVCLSPPIYSKFIMSNMFGLTPFIDNMSYISQLTETGLPFIDDDIIIFPAGNNYHDLLELTCNNSLELDDSSYAEVDKNNITSMLTCAPLVASILSSIGIIRDYSDCSKYFDSWFK